MRLAIPVLAAALFAAPALAQTYEGTAKEVYVTIGTQNSENEEVGFIIDGEPARRIYEAMQAPPQEDLCTGGLTKEDVSGFNCFASPGGEYGCSFGYDLTTQRVTRGPVSC